MSDRITTNKREIRIRPEDERGDIAKSIQELINAQFISKRFNDIMGATRMSMFDIVTFSLLNITRVTSKMLSLSAIDVSEEALSKMTEDEKQETLDLWSLKKRIMINPHALSYIVHEASMYMYALGLQSLDGKSREEGVIIVSGIQKRIMNPENMGRVEKWKRRLLGDVLFLE